MIVTHSSIDHPLRLAIAKAYRMNEADCLQHLTSIVDAIEMDIPAIKQYAEQLVIETRAYKKKTR